MAKDDEPVRYFKEQFDDEEVVMVFRKHPIVMRKGFLFACIGLLVPILCILALTVIFANNPDRLPSVNSFYIAFLLGFVLAFFIMLPSWIGWHYSVYIVTSQRFIQITQEGLFKRSMVALGLEQVQMVNYEINGFIETIFGFGTMVVQTFVGSLTIRDVHRPAKIQKEFLHTLRNLGYSAAAQASIDSSEENYEE